MDDNQHLIGHELEKGIIYQRANDGYINATALCKACGKEMKHYLENQTTKDFLLELSGSVGIPTDLLVQKIMTGPNELRGTWVHPQVAINLGQWSSPKFAVLVSKWVFEWMSGTQKIRDARIEEVSKLLMLHIENTDNKLSEHDKAIDLFAKVLNYLIEHPEENKEEEYKKVGFDTDQ